MALCGSGVGFFREDFAASLAGFFSSLESHALIFETTVVGKKAQKSIPNLPLPHSQYFTQGAASTLWHG